MPTTTTPFLPSSVHANAPVASYIKLPDFDPPRPQQPPRVQRAAASGAISAPSFTPSDSVAPAVVRRISKTARPAPKTGPPTNRRSTLASRFPLLRKTSREDRGHLRASSTTSASPFHSTGAPRASSSSSRGLVDRPIDEQHSDAVSIASLSPDTDTTSLLPSDTSRSATPAAFTPPTPSDSESAGSKLDKVRSAISPRTAKATDKKMHQTSSRLLRMTDDERPFTRVSTFILHDAGGTN